MRPTSIPEAQSLKPTLKTFLYLWPYIWPRAFPWIRARVGIAVAALVLAKVASILTPLYLKDIINTLSFLTLPIGLIIAYTVARISSSLFAEVRDSVFATVTQRALRELGLQVFRHLHSLGLRYHLERQTGGLSNAIDRGTKAIENLLVFLSFNIVPTFVEIILVCGLFWWFYSYLYALITVLAMVAYVFYTLKITEWRIRFIRTMNTNDREAHTKAIDSLLNYETVKYFGNEDYEATRFDTSLLAYERAAVKSKLSLSILNIGQTLIISLGLAAVMILAAHQVMTKVISVGDFVAMNILLIQLYIPLFNLGFAYREVKLSLVNLEEMFGFLHVPQEVQDHPQAKPYVFKGGEIIFDHVDFNYMAERTILKDVSFHVPPGQTFAIVGASGAGKSTIARLLFRFYDVTKGAILIDGQETRTLTQASLRQVIGIVPQDTVLFNDTILYNIAYGNPHASRVEIEQAAKHAHIHEFITSLPEGYNSRVGERGLKLSGGEKQRVAIARTLLKKPKIFLFDEATSALDTRTEKEIQKNLQEISVNHTTLIIAHRLSTVIHADQILVLDHGKIVERGRHEDLLTQEGVYAKMWRRQQKQAITPAVLGE